jgi:hypothetical protein
MTVDERIEALTERHEALTQTVEHLAIESAKHDRQIGELARIAMTAHESINSLLRIVESHEHRVTALEDGEKPQ